MGKFFTLEEFVEWLKGRLDVGRNRTVSSCGPCAEYNNHMIFIGSGGRRMISINISADCRYTSDIIKEGSIYRATKRFVEVSYNIEARRDMRFPDAAQFLGHAKELATKTASYVELFDSEGHAVGFVERREACPEHPGVLDWAGFYRDMFSPEAGVEFLVKQSGSGSVAQYCSAANVKPLEGDNSFDLARRILDAGAGDSEVVREYLDKLDNIDEGYRPVDGGHLVMNKIEPKSFEGWYLAP